MRADTVHRGDSFHLEIEGVSRGSFVSCSGLSARVAVVEYTEGGAEAPRKFRGERRFSTIVLEKGVAQGHELYEWFQEGDRREGAVVLLSPAGAEVMRWAFTQGWPCRWEGPLLDARSSRVALELIEITHEGLQCAER